MKLYIDFFGDIGYGQLWLQMHIYTWTGKENA